MSQCTWPKKSKHSHGPVYGVDDGKLHEGGKDEQGAAKEPIVEVLDIAHLGTDI